MTTDLVDVITDVVKKTKRKADLPSAIADALIEADLTSFVDDVTVFVADPKLSPTHTIETDQGVLIEYRNDTPISYHFPASAVIEVQS